MKTFRAEISDTQSVLTPLMARRYESGNTAYNLGQIRETLSKNIAKAYSLLYQVLTGNQAQDDLDVFTVNASNGAFKRFYGPTICCNAKRDGLILLMGSESILLTLKKGKLENLSLPEGMDLAAKVAKEKVGNFDEVIVKVSIYIEGQDTLLVYPIPLRLKIEENDEGQKVEPDFDALEQAFERNIKSLLPMVGDVPQLSDFDGPLIKLSQLDEDSVYKVVGYRACKPSGRLSFILHILPTEPEQGYDKDGEYTVFESELGAEVWGNSSLVGPLSAKPEITEEKPAELIIRGMRQNKSGTTTVDCALIIAQPELKASDLEAELDLDF